MRVCRHEGMREHKHDVQKPLAACFIVGCGLFFLVILCLTGCPVPAAAQYHKRASFHILLALEMVNIPKSYGLYEVHVFHAITKLRSHKPNHCKPGTVCVWIRNVLCYPTFMKQRTYRMCFPLFDRFWREVSVDSP